MLVVFCGAYVDSTRLSLIPPLTLLRTLFHLWQCSLSVGYRQNNDYAKSKIFLMPEVISMV